MYRRKSGGAPRHRGLSHDVPVTRVMSTDLVGVSEDWGVVTVTRLLLERGLTGAPVLGTDGSAVGVISMTDLSRHALDSAASGTSSALVGDIMTPFAYSVPASASLAQAAALMAFEGIHLLPVTAPASGKVLGVVRALDVLRWMGAEDGYLPRAADEEDDEAAVA